MKKVVSWILLAAVWLASLMVYLLKYSSLEIFAIPMAMTILLVVMGLFRCFRHHRVLQELGEGSHKAVTEERNLEVLSTMNLLSCILVAAVQFYLLYCFSTGHGSLSRLENILLAFLGLLLVLIGNLLPKLRPNKYIGIRLPWIMNDEIRWAKTHRFGGFAMVICGVVMLVGSLFASAPAYTHGVLLLFTIGVILVYSWIVKG